jgi:hypothetical protein
MQASSVPQIAGGGAAKDGERVYIEAVIVTGALQLGKSYGYASPAFDPILLIVPAYIVAYNLMSFKFLAKIPILTNFLNALYADVSSVEGTINKAINSTYVAGPYEAARASDTMLVAMLVYPLLVQGGGLARITSGQFFTVQTLVQAAMGAGLTFLGFVVSDAVSKIAKTKPSNIYY